MQSAMTKGQMVLIIAGLAGADRRTARKFIEGKPIKGNVLRERLELAARQAEQLQGSPTAKVDVA